MCRSMHIPTHTYVHTDTCTPCTPIFNVYTHAYAYVYAHVHAPIYTHVFTHVSSHVHVHVCTQVTLSRTPNDANIAAKSA